MPEKEVPRRKLSPATLTDARERLGPEGVGFHAEHLSEPHLRLFKRRPQMPVRRGVVQILLEVTDVPRVGAEIQDGDLDETDALVLFTRADAVKFRHPLDDSTTLLHVKYHFARYMAEADISLFANDLGDPVLSDRMASPECGSTVEDALDVDGIFRKQCGDPIGILRGPSSTIFVDGTSHEVARQHNAPTINPDMTALWELLRDSSDITLGDSAWATRGSASSPQPSVAPRGCHGRGTNDERAGEADVGAMSAMALPSRITPRPKRRWRLPL
mmetsp:Transcript_65702/g.182900  ORF Transcript_65702/g.182900 Transcript_65702/m.182900 type:complete len:273 (+) Transcript_65702:1049-1867(+)